MELRVAVLPVRWRRDSSHPPPHPPEWYRRLFCDVTAGGLATWWSTETEGQVVMTGKAVSWFDLSIASPESVREFRGGHPTQFIGNAELMSVAQMECPEDLRIPGPLPVLLENPDLLIVVLDADVPAGWTVHWGEVYPIIISRIGAAVPAVLTPPGANHAFLAHEIGHALGLNHSFGSPLFKDPDAIFGEYGHPYCIMSAEAFGGHAVTVDPREIPGMEDVANKGPGVSGATRFARGWAGGIQMVLGVDLMLSLGSLGSAPGGTKVIHVFANAQETYTVEFRSPADANDRGLPCPLVVISAFRGSTADRTYPGYNCATFLHEMRADHSHAMTTAAGLRVDVVQMASDMRSVIVRVSFEAPPSSAGEEPVPQPKPVLYTIDGNGRLFWHPHPDAWEGAETVDRGTEIDWDRDPTLKQFGGGKGIFYRIDIQKSGDLFWRRHLGRDNGTSDWVHDSSTGAKFSRVGFGWGDFLKVFADGEGHIYGVTPDGTLLWYHHRGFETGAVDWAGGFPVNTGWHIFRHIFAAGQGIIYAVHPNGALLWYRHEMFDDSSWNWQGPRVVGWGWDAFQVLAAAEEGTIYALQFDGSLLWFRHHGRRDGSFIWSGPKLVGTGLFGKRLLISN